VIYESSVQALVIFAVAVAAVLGLSFHLGRKTASAGGYFAAHGQVGWFVNGIAFAGDYLSAASFLGICGMIAFYGYDGFLYSIGYLAGWIVALFVIAEPIRRLGKYTFADALDAKFKSKGIKVAAAVSTLVVSVFYLIPQMVGAGALVKPLLGLPHWAGVVIVGVTVTLIVVTAGMVSTTWVQFIKGSLLVVFCTILVGLILGRGFSVAAAPDGRVLGRDIAADAQRLEKLPGGVVHVNGAPLSRENQLDTGLRATFGTGFGSVAALPDGATSTGPLGPVAFIGTFMKSEIVTWRKRELRPPDVEHPTTIYEPKVQQGADLLLPGSSPTFAGTRAPELSRKLDFFSLMLALFCGTASLPHILIRYYTVKDADAARKSTVVGIAAIGTFYVLTLYLGLGAMTSGALDPTDSNMAAPLLAKSFSDTLFAVISAIAFTTVLGTVSGLILAGAGAVAHDLVGNTFGLVTSDEGKVRVARATSVALGTGAMVLGMLFADLNVSFLVGWAFNIAASANLPALVMLLFWKGTTKQGIIAAVFTGLFSSLAWVLLSAEALEKVYGFTAAGAAASSIVPFSQPALVTIPLGFVVLVVVSLLTKPPAATR
jgi:cation/acetate symporter